MHLVDFIIRSTTHVSALMGHDQVLYKDISICNIMQLRKDGVLLGSKHVVHSKRYAQILTGFLVY